jgi:hypothetical protein
MERHPYFDLWLHTTPELTELLAAIIVERTTLHEWPLSCVQRLRLGDGRCLIYKSQVREGVEAQFYARARSSLLPWHHLLGEYENSVAMLLGYVDSPRLEEMQLSDTEIFSHGRQILAEIRHILGDVPVYQDISTVAKWQAYTADTLAKWQALIDKGVFRLSMPATVNRLAEWVGSPVVHKAILNDPTLIHCDLSGENIFVTPTGYRLIDWQYPRRAPAEVDWACYLEGMGMNPLEFADPTMVRLLWFIRLNWFVECKTRLFPPGETYDQQVADLAQAISAK